MDDCKVRCLSSQRGAPTNVCIDQGHISVSCHRNLNNDIRLIYYNRIIDGETTGGGFPGWVGNVAGSLRTNNPSYQQGDSFSGSLLPQANLMALTAWTPYMTAISKIIARNQISNGGPSEQCPSTPLKRTSTCI